MGLIKVLPVSGPSRGIGSFLLYRESITISKENLFPALSRYGWVPTRKEVGWTKLDEEAFPAPREGWVVSHLVRNSLTSKLLTSCFRPLSRYGWFPTESPKVEIPEFQGFPAPLEVWVGSYLTGHMISYYGIKAFPSPLEVWVGSYASSIKPNETAQDIVSGPSRGIGGFLPGGITYITKNV